jgi:DNA-binding response OmpR family regulator
MLIDYLSARGLEAETRADAAAGLAALQRAPYDAVVLDVMLPDLDGFEVCRRIRATSAVPILMLTARGDEEDRIVGLELGADDYLPKPFEIPELLARLRVIERRLSSVQDSTIHLGEIELDTLSRAVRRNGETVELARREYMLLKALMENAGKIQARESLENQLYAWGEEIASNALEVHVHHLRKKLGNDFIKTVRGVGYVVRKP